MNKIELTKQDLRTLRKEYEKEGKPLSQLAFDWDMCVASVRRLLVEAGATIRGRGGR